MMQDPEPGGAAGRNPDAVADGRRTRPRRPRGTRYPWRASIYLTQEDGERLEEAAARLETSVPEAVRQAVKSGLPLVLDKVRKRQARRKGGGA